MTKAEVKRPEMRHVDVTGKVTQMTNADKQAKSHIMHFKTNKIRTTKYNIFSFFPKALLYQFTRFANVYFLITAIIQSIPYVSPLNPFSAILPLLFVLGVSMIREGVEDYSRYKTDCQINNSKATILKEGKWTEVLWREIFVGDFIRIKNEERFPTDILVLSTSYKKESKGACFIETASLDGERNLKPKSAIPEVMNFVDQKGFESLQGKLTCSLPNPNLHSFDGVIEIEGKQYAINAKQLLLRGASLRNTEYIEGMVVYTGHDSKVMKNSENARFKTSKMESVMNSLIMRLLILQALLYLAAMVGFLAWNISVHHNYRNFWVYEFNFYVEAVLMIFTYFILFNTMLPISLIVTLELVKVCQSYFISVDKDFYNAKKDKGCKVMTRSINEEVGQVEYVFSDKTGTLTCNEMELKYLMIGNTIYQGTLKAKEASHNVYSNLDEFYDPRIRACLKDGGSEKLAIKLSAQGGEEYVIENRKQLAQDFMTLLATCHDCMVDINKEDKNVLNYEGPSPDEICLVSAARQQDYVFFGNTSGSMVIEALGEKVEIPKRCLFEFDNKRKMMSVIIEQKVDGKVFYKLLCKGADSAILSRLSSQEQPFLETAQAQLAEWSKYGLRTLCMGMKILSKKELDDVIGQLTASSLSANKEQLMEELMHKIEKDLFLIGCSAVEDRLQDQVPETIARLLEAGIKVWMLTGDKMETAENIGLSCRLINNDEFELIRMNFDAAEDADDFLMEAKEKYRAARDRGKKCCTIIEGIALGFILESRERSLKYLAIMKDCESVICCRVTPKQKAQVVRLVKRNLGKIALAIGDGANDVNMIQEGDIGVGIFGLEGMQAANSSDFAIPEFKALDKLLFVHGRWSYIRNSEMILYFFYKNMLFTIPQFFFIFINAYSGLSLFDTWYMTFYNMIFTALPLAAKAIFDQDVHYLDLKKDAKGKMAVHQNDKIFAMIPYVYKVGQKDSIFNNINFLLWIGKGILHGFLVWLICLFSCTDANIISSSGNTPDFWYVSIIMFTSIFVVATLQIIFMTRYWTVINLVLITIFSITPYIAWMFIADVLHSYVYASGSQDQIWGSPIFYLLILLNAGWFTLYDFCERFIREWFGHNLTTKARVTVQSGAVDRMTREDFAASFDTSKLADNKIRQKDAPGRF